MGLEITPIQPENTLWAILVRLTGNYELSVPEIIFPEQFHEQFP